MPRLLPAALAALLAAAAPAAAADDDPTALLEALYARQAESLASEDATPALFDPELRAEFFSPELVALLEDDDRIAEQEGMGCLDFDPIYNGQDFDITELEIGPAERVGDQAEVRVTFDNFDEGNVLLYTLSDQGEGWRIDEIQEVTDGVGWTLSDILACRA